MLPCTVKYMSNSAYLEAVLFLLGEEISLNGKTRRDYTNTANGRFHFFFCFCHLSTSCTKLSSQSYKWIWKLKLEPSCVLDRQLKEQ